MRLKISWRRFLAKPAEALALVYPATPPQVRERIAIITRITPVTITFLISSPALILLTRLAVIKGIRHSITTSPTIKRIVIIVGSLNSLMLPANFFIIFSPIDNKVSLLNTQKLILILAWIYNNINSDFEIVYDEDAFEDNTGEYDVTRYYDELGIYHSGTVIGGYYDYAILSLARYIQFVSDTTDEEEYRRRAPQYFNVDRACRYYLHVMTMGMIDNFAKNTIINMYGDDVWWYSFYDLDRIVGLSK